MKKFSLRFRNRRPSDPRTGTLDSAAARTFDPTRTCGAKFRAKELTSFLADLPPETRPDPNLRRLSPYRKAQDHLRQRLPRDGPPPVSPRRVSWSEWLGTFLERRNIFWGELVGGLLIVGCSIALLLSLWQTLERIPLFPFLAAASGTWAFYGIGRYSLSHWKLETSTRNLLVIATLLVPLNFLVLAGISPRSNHPIELLAKIASIAAFALLVRGAGTVLLPDPAGSKTRGWLLSLAMVGPALAPLLAARVYQDQASEAVALLLALPVACQTLAIAGAVFAHRRVGRLDGQRRSRC